MDASLGTGIALHTDRLARTFAGTGVGRGALATDGKTALVADATIALDTREALEIHAEFAAEIAFDDVLAVLDGVNDLGHLLFGQVLGADRGVDLGVGQNDVGIGRSDAVDVAERDINALFAGNFNSDNTCHKKLALFLFVPGIRANHTDDALAFNNFAIFAKFFD